MAVNFNGTTPAAPANSTNVSFQVDVSGNVSASLPTSAQSLTGVDLTAQAANIAATTLLAVATSARYRVSAYIIVTTAGSVSSTLPKVTITWTDVDNNTGQTVDLTATQAGNALTTFAQGSAVISAKAANNIQYATSGYASSAAGMQYALHITLEKL